MIGLITDYGISGPYIGQVLAVLYQQAPTTPIINLLADAPPHNPRATAYLLPSYTQYFPSGSIFLCVIDPGVGSDQDRPVIVKADGKWFVGPDNGLFTPLRQVSHEVESWEITWRPQFLSASFHGRDLYAPIVAALARGESPPARLLDAHDDGDWPLDLYEIIYVDHFGNLITGIRSTQLSMDSILSCNGASLNHAKTFAAVAPGQAFWYGNSNGLVEIAVNKGRAEQQFAAKIGDIVCRQIATNR